MKRQRITKSSILEIHINNEYYVYAQILEDNSAYLLFFDYKSIAPLTDFSSLKFAPILFIIAVYNDVITRGEWLKVGKMEVREDGNPMPLKYIKDADGYFRLYNPNTGKMWDATKEECRGLEVAAVWDSHHVEERISDHYNGKVCDFVKKYTII